MDDLTSAIDDGCIGRLAALASFEAIAASSQNTSRKPWCRESLHERSRADDHGNQLLGAAELD